MRIVTRFAVLVVASLLVATVTSAQVTELDKGDWPPPGSDPAAILTAGNPIYDIFVEDAGGGCGTWTALTGASHPAGPGLNVLYGDGFPGTSNTTLRDYSGGGLTDYTTGSSCTVLCSLAAPVVVTTPTSITLTWTFVNALGTTVEFTQEVSVLGPAVGATVDNTVIRETHTVTNLDGPPLEYGLRKHWDWQIGFNDGPWIGDCDTPSLACDVSMNFPGNGGTPPPVYTINEDPGSPAQCPAGVVPNTPAGCTGSPLYLVAGTVSPPSALVPAPDTPELMQFNAWPSLISTCWEPALSDNAFCGGGDTSLAYFYGRTAASAEVLAAGASETYTQYVVAGVDECPGVVVVPFHTPWGLIGFGSLLVVSLTWLIWRRSTRTAGLA